MALSLALTGQGSRGLELTVALRLGRGAEGSLFVQETTLTAAGEAGRVLPMQGAPLQPAMPVTGGWLLGCCWAAAPGGCWLLLGGVLGAVGVMPACSSPHPHPPPRPLSQV